MEGSEEGAPADAVLEAITTIAADADIDRIMSRFAAAVVALVGGTSGVLTVAGHLDLPARSYAAPATEGEETARTLTVPILVGPREVGALQVGWGETHTVSEDDRRLVTTFARAAGVVISVSRDLTRSERRHRWLAASATLATLLHDLGTADVMAVLAAHVRATAAATTVAVVVLDETAPAPEAVPTGMTDDPRPRIVGHDGTAYADVAALAQALTPALVAAGRDGRVRAVDAPDGTGVLLAPLRAEVARGGLLLVGYGVPRHDLDPEEAGMLASFADHVSLVLDRVQALRDRQQLMLLGDRERIARDLHDQVIQRIFAAGLQLERVRRVSDSDEVRERLTRTIEDLDGTISEIRRTIFRLELPRSASVRAEISAIVQEYAEVLDFRPELVCEGPVDAALDPEVAEHLMAVVRECLSNVARHARATACRVEVVVDAQRLCLTVTDDGVGARSPRAGQGLRNVAERAEGLGGRLEVTTPAGGGTRLQWEVPSAPVAD